MIIAVASEGLNVAHYFDRCQNFNYFTVDNGAVVDYRNLPIAAIKNGDTAAILRELDVDVIIVGCIDASSRKALEDCGITVFSGALGDALQSAEAYITDTFIATDEDCVGADDEPLGYLLLDAHS